MGGKHFNKGKHTAKKENKKLKGKKVRIFSLLLIIILVIFGINFMREADFIEGITKEKNSISSFRFNGHTDSKTKLSSSSAPNSTL